ncbi:MAG: glycosyltransferase family 8 protein [Flavobacteriaceae bacterium]|nr:glycosyltransferase family 8 protein [Flavobacteriaceae bacterium]
MLKLPIVLTCDDKYFKYASVVIASLIENRNKKVQYEINVLSEYISPENKSKAIEQVKKYSNFELKFIALDSFDASRFFLNSYMSVSTYYRFYIPEIFKDYERILYLDCDVIVDADISEMATMDFEDKLVICCSSPYIYNKIKNGDDEVYTKDYFKNVLKMPNPLEYFNAGVMLYNLKKINELNVSEKFFEAIEEIKKPLLQDQDILNSVLSRNGGVKLISNKYNMTRSYKITKNRLLLNAVLRFFNLLDKANQLFYIYHYVGKDKPWQEENIDSNLFFHYAKKSPFYQEILEGG